VRQQDSNQRFQTADDSQRFPRRPAAQPAGQGDYKGADNRCHEPVRVLIKNAPDPFGNGKQEHVVAVGGRPVGDGHAHALAGDEPADADQDQRGQRREDGEPVEPRFTGGTHHDSNYRKKLAHKNEPPGKQPVPAVPEINGFYCAPGAFRVKSRVTSLSLTSMSFVTGLPPLALRWTASTVYLPGGTLAILNLPSTPLTEK
jgi:hypothetical protein